MPAGEPLADGPLSIVLNGSLDMSTGKAAAQGAHALFAWLLESEPALIERWMDAGCPVAVSELGADAFAAAAATATGPVIRDAGRTEIEPGSPTAFVVLDAEGLVAEVGNTDALGALGREDGPESGA